MYREANMFVRYGILNTVLAIASKVYVQRRLWDLQKATEKPGGNNSWVNTDFHRLR